MSIISKSTSEPFKRKYYIKDLFHAKQIINCFNTVEFEDPTTFVRAINDGFFRIEKKLVIISIFSKADFEVIAKIMKETDICKQLAIKLVIDSESVLKEIMSSFEGLDKAKFDLIIDCMIDVNLNDFAKVPALKEWCQNNPVWIHAKITAANYKQMFVRLPYCYVHNGFRFFKLDFDYKSFENIRMSELHELEFFIMHFVSWVMEAKKTKDNQIVFFDTNSQNKSIFVANDYSLYYNRAHFEERIEPPLINLAKYVLDTGETISFMALNRLRQYMDLSEDIMSFNVTPLRCNWYLMDYYQNFLIMGHINEVPIIVSIIMTWLGVMN